MAKPEPLKRYHLTNHAKEEMVRRQISEVDIDQVLSSPEQVISIQPGRKVYQSRVEMGNPPVIYLLRVFIDIDHKLPMVVTAYRTSKITKVWSSEL